MAEVDTAPPAEPAEPPEPESSPGTWRDDVIVASGCAVVAGIWLLISPFVLGYAADDTMWNPIACGVIVVLLGLLRVLTVQRATAVSTGSAAVGVWLFVSAFWLAASSQAIWNTWLLGVLVFVLGVLSVASMPRSA